MNRLITVESELIKSVAFGINGMSYVVSEGDNKVHSHGDDEDAIIVSIEKIKFEGGKNTTHKALIDDGFERRVLTQGHQVVFQYTKNTEKCIKVPENKMAQIMQLLSGDYILQERVAANLSWAETAELNDDFGYLCEFNPQMIHILEKKPSIVEDVFSLNNNESFAKKGLMNTSKLMSRIISVVITGVAKCSMNPCKNPMCIKHHSNNMDPALCSDFKKLHAKAGKLTYTYGQPNKNDAKIAELMCIVYEMLFSHKTICPVQGAQMVEGILAHGATADENYDNMFWLIGNYFSHRFCTCGSKAGMECLGEIFNI